MKQFLYKKLSENTFFRLNSQKMCDSYEFIEYSEPNSGRIGDQLTTAMSVVNEWLEKCYHKTIPEPLKV